MSRVTKRPATLFYAFLLLHVLVWTLLPAWLNSNLPLDAVEHTAWGREWQWGYHKHPPMVAWLPETLVRLLGRADWVVYLLAQLCVALAFWSMWRLALEFVEPRRALLSVLLLEAVAYHNFTSPEFNVNVALLGFWALTVLLFWRATRRDSLRAWALTGAAAAAAILSKYLAVFLLLPLFLYLLVDDQARAQLRRPGPYLGLACFLALLAPHLAWVWQHDFVTLGYGLQRTGVGEHPGWSAHLLNPLRFLLAQAAHLVLPLLLLWLLARPAWQAGSDASRRYLLFAGLGPLLGFLVISALTGMRLRSMWGTPLLAIAGLYLVYHLLPPAATWRWRRFALGWGLAAALFPLAYALAYQADPSKRTHYPGRELARQFEAYWEARFQRPLSIVIGDEWFAGNVGWYAVARPSVYLEVDPAIATWVDDVRVRAHGALLVWDTHYPLLAAEELHRRFGAVITGPPLATGWRSEKAGQEVLLGWAMVPPRDEAEGL